MRRLLLIGLVLGAAASASAAVVVERWGVGGHVQHPKTLSYKAQGGHTVMTFELSALPKDAKVYRARLVMFRKGRWGYTESFQVRVPIAKQPFAPVPPYCRWYDVTDAARKATGSSRSMSFEVLGSGCDGNRTYLEIAYEGKLKDPPKQVTGLKAFYRAGQVFITWNEIEDLSQGKDRYPWGDLIKKVSGYHADGLIPNDKAREVRYRVYCHDQPITAKTIGDAELLAEVAPGSGFNTRIVRRIWQGENRPSKLDDAFIAVRLGVEPKGPLKSGVGVHVHTCRKAGRRYYAVVTAVNGVENTVDLGPGVVSGPIDQKVAPVEPVLQSESFKKGAYNRKENDVITRRYCIWAVPPLAPRPLQYGFVVRYHPNRIGDRPAPLELSHGKAHTNEPELSRWQRPDAILLAGSGDPHIGFYVGVNNCHETLKSFSQGTWAPWTWNRHKHIIEWMKKNYKIDEQQIYCYGSHWGMWELRHPEIFCAFIGWGSGELTKGFVDWNRARGVLGPPSAYQGKPREQNPYEMLNLTKYAAADPRRTLPVQFLIPCTGSHTGEMSYPALPRYKRALMDAKQPFAAAIGKASWGFRTPAALTEFRAGRLKILRDQSKPAFANCTLDDNPGCGDIGNGDDCGMLNGYLLWDTKNIVDKPGEWQMTVYLHKSAPLSECKVDLTPRHCQGFKAKPGQRFRWTNTPLKDNKEIQSGTVTAGKWGLVTLEKVMVTKGKSRIAIAAAE